MIEYTIRKNSDWMKYAKVKIQDGRQYHLLHVFSLLYGYHVVWYMYTMVFITNKPVFDIENLTESRIFKMAEKYFWIKNLGYILKIFLRKLVHLVTHTYHANVMIIQLKQKKLKKN